MARDRKPVPVLITDAAESQDDQLRRRQVRYLVMMLTRALCLIVAAILVSARPPLLGLWLALCVAGMVLLPWFAVILANDRPPKRRADRGSNRAGGATPALPSQRSERVIDAT